MVIFWIGSWVGAVEGMGEKFYCRDFLKVVAPSLQYLFVVHKKMTVLIIDSEKLNIIGLPMAILSKSLQIPLTIA
ncbi:unnamed protein product [Heligmosomoides polygyrus]|uniref:Ovule protein n=1 Tax=Heligmosomoides polygyrus TaxID=6339 RepID=A0A183GE14_HELPZ|nr:unnamed protein product [Heligmosomoides polygyrus]